MVVVMVFIKENNFSSNVNPSATKSKQRRIYCNVFTTVGEVKQTMV